MTIRAIDREDVEDFCGLARQLGYQADPAYILSRLEKPVADETVLMAFEGERAIGWIDARVSETMLAGRHAEIVGFVVDEGARHRGVGKALLAAAEAWIRGRGLGRVLVRSNVIRERAHAFYLREGYERAKTSAVFAKDL
jgi:GNAT superfamily N-acetyltransferase